jgi:hypothetical protein
MTRDDTTYFVHRYDKCRTELLVETVLIRLIVIFTSVMSLWIQSDIGLLILSLLGAVAFTTFVLRKSELIRELRAIHRAFDAFTQSEGGSYSLFGAYVEQLHQYGISFSTLVLSTIRSEFLFLVLFVVSLGLRLTQVWH